ncbi:hypothetical protein MTO96_002231 [Rhipicephalus appendiculatus]
MLAKVNGNEVRAYIDLGSQCVIIRREDADRVEIKYSVMEKPLAIGAYGSGRVTPCVEANVNLTVDQATAHVPTLIVPNESQAIPIIVRQPFTEQLHVTVVRRRNTVRVFEEEWTKVTTPYSPSKLQIFRGARSAFGPEFTVVPPNYVGFAKPYVTGSEPNADVFVDAQPRCQEGREPCIQRCTVKVDAANETCIPVMNASYQQLNIKVNELDVRSEACYLDEEPMQDVKSSCTATRPCSTATVNVRTGPSVTPEYREKLDRLIRGVS